MDVLYILGNGSKCGNNEIKYSLRSLEKYGRNYDRVFITGVNPTFLNDTIIYNYHTDNYIANVNHLMKVLWTFKNTDISDDALINYDDNFFVQDVDISKYPYYYKREQIPKEFPISNIHVRSLLATRKILEEMKKPIKDFAVHCPVIYNRQRFYEFIEKFNSLYDINSREKAISIRCAYLNYFEEAGQYMKDVKINGLVSKQEIEEKIKNRHIFSISDNVTRGGIVQFFEERYPNKSKWEI